MITYILSADTERYEACLKRLPESVAGEVKRICVTPENVGEVPEWFNAPTDRWCITMATVKALEAARDSDEDCLYFEDDAIFRADFEKWYPQLLEALPEDWDQLFLGGQLGLDTRKPLHWLKDTDLLLHASAVHRNHAVLTRKESLQRCIDWYLSDGEGWPCRQTCDWRILYLQKQLDWQVYVPAMGWLVGQGAMPSLLDHREYPDRWWHFTYPESLFEREGGVV